MTKVKSLNAAHLDLTRGVVLDVRTPVEHAQARLAAPHAHVPLDALDPEAFMAGRGLSPEADVYIVCHKGPRARQAAERFAAAGYYNVHVVEGGIVACEGCGHPVDKRAGGPVSLERQVRIGAGALVALGAGAALALSPLWALVPLFVGCGLIFAGVTDRCGMALMLAKAPWNRV